MIDPIPRRSFLALAAVTGSSWAVQVSGATLPKEALLLADIRLSDDERTLVNAHATDMLLDHGAVVAWRRQLITVLQSGKSVTAYTRWDLALLLADLARENGRRFDQTRITGSITETRIAQMRGV